MKSPIVVNMRSGCDYDIRIDRRSKSKWGNRFIIGKDGDRKTVIDKYRKWLQTNTALLADLHELEGKVLGCWCVKQPIDYVRKNKQCHGEVLVEFVRREAK